MMMRYCLALLIVMFFTQVHAQEGVVNEEEVVVSEEAVSQDVVTEAEAIPHTTVRPDEVVRRVGSDREAVTPQRFDSKKWKAIINGKSYTSKKKLKKRNDMQGAGSEPGKTRRKSWWGNDEEEADEDNSSSFNFGGSPVVGFIFNLIIYGIIAVVIGVIIYIIVKSVSLKGRGGRVDKDVQADDFAQVEDIRELEIDRALREAMQAGNYRLVIRIYFLGLLKRLDEDGVIAWKKDKTNRDYLSELFTKAYHFDEIENLTYAYERVWFSDHIYSAAAYMTIIDEFKAVNQKLKTPGAR